MIRVAIIGTGTVSKHLQDAFKNSNEVDLIQVLPSRTKAFSKALQKVMDDEEQPDVYIIAVSDDAIKEVAQGIKKSSKLVVHTSGSVRMSSLPKGIRRGVFYPLQTFSQNRKIPFRNIPICIEAEQDEDVIMLKKMALAVSESVYEISSNQRQSLHLAAVFVNNFTNQMYHIGSEICQENRLSFDILRPLIKETAAKIESLSPLEAQTGPAKRNDEITIEKHLSLLHKKTYHELYQTLTKSIKETHGKKL